MSEILKNLGIVFPTVDIVKPKLRIVVFGPYKPDNAFTRLANFRDFLRDNGYSNTNLVADLNVPHKQSNQSFEEYLVFKCQYWLENADVVLFTLFRNARLEGVATEFTHLIDFLKGRMWRAIVLYEQNDLSSMIGGRLNLFQREIQQTDFDGDQDLYDKSLGLLINYPKKLFFELRDR